MANTAFGHDATLTTPGSTTNTALVRWANTSGSSLNNTANILSDGSHITLNARGEVRFADADSSHYIALEAPATVGTTYTMALPADLPAANEVLTVTSYSSGAGVLEWAAAAGANCKVGSFTRDTSAAVGTQVVSGIGFTPKSVIFLAVQDGSHEMSMGLDDGTDARVVHHDHPTTADTFALNTTKSIRTIHASGGNTFNGKITALASGQFTVTWDKVGSPTGTLTVMYLAIG